ncbi:unnamed protein product, partial [Mycena citricolor]
FESSLYLLWYAPVGGTWRGSHVTLCCAVAAGKPLEPPQGIRRRLALTRPNPCASTRRLLALSALSIVSPSWKKHDNAKMACTWSYASDALWRWVS